MENLIINISLILIGVIMLYYGAEFLVKGSSSLAITFGISPLIVGLTVVAFGTSAPELFVSFTAGMKDSSDIAIGNVIGSNICNIGLILGLSALIMPVRVNIKAMKIDIALMILASLAVWIMIIDNEIGRFEGFILTFGILAYVAYTIKKVLKGKDVVETEVVAGQKKKSKGFYILLIISGLGILIIGSNLFIEGAIQIAKTLGVSNAIIGLSLVAFGTSLPELATSVLAAVKKQSDISLGNVIGSNIFNLLFILGITAILFPIGAGDIQNVDYIVMILLAVIIIPMGLIKKQYGRIDGLLLLLIYFAYMYYLFVNLPK